MFGVLIRTSNTNPGIGVRLAVPRNATSSRWFRRTLLKLHRKTYRRKLIRFGLVGSNFLVLGIIVSLVVMNIHGSSASASEVVAPVSTTAAVANPLDQVSSANIALTVARMDSLPESTAITNQADSEAASVAMSSVNNSVVSKPQVVQTALKSRADIHPYVTKAGDTVASIASQFGVTSNSILWSNDLRSNTVAAGQTLTIPPINGIVYSVKTGDTPATLAAKFSANQDQIIAFNDAEIAGITPGEQIIIPNGIQAATTSTVSPSGAVGSTSAAGGFPWGSGPVYGNNGYDYGYCTYYVASRISVPNNWGNASSWSYYASLSGWNVSATPTVGAIAQTPDAAGGEGHVAIVEAVSPDGTQMKFSDMNGIAGWGRVGYSGWVPANKFPHYITH